MTIVRVAESGRNLFKRRGGWRPSLLFLAHVVIVLRRRGKVLRPGSYEDIGGDRFDQFGYGVFLGGEGMGPIRVFLAENSL